MAGDFVFLSGVSGREFSIGWIKGLDVKLQTRTAWEKIEAILNEAGSSLIGIVKMGISLRRAEDYDAYPIMKRPANSSILIARTFWITLQP